MTNNPNDRRFGQVWAVQGYTMRPARRFAPPADIIELEDQIVVLVEIAGMKADNFKIALHNQRLVVGGQRQRLELEAIAYHQAEVGFGEFRLVVPMPWSIIEEEVNASYRNGFLRIDLPRRKAQRVHIVDVNSSED
ncbi:MAG: Hsp20/alpha crystallin family protein [Chloroflexota bacterium]